MKEIPLSQRAARLRPSPTLALAAEALARRARGQDIVSFAAGEPDFDTPAFVKRAAQAALDAGFTKYTATAGIPELRQAICDHLRAEQGLDYQPAQVIVSCGAKQSLFNFFAALLDEGDEVLIPSPYWVSYPEQVAFVGGHPIFVPCREAEGFEVSAEALEAAVTPRTKALILNSPCNPTGALFSRQRLEEIAQFLERHPQVLLVSDDIYEKLVYGDAQFLNVLSVAPALRERTLLVSGFSKTFAMTGWRIGYAAGPAALVSAMQRIQDQSTSNPTSFAQKGALAALTAPKEELEASLGTMRREFDRRRQRMLQRLRQLPGLTCVEPKGAFYVFPGVSGWLSRRFKGERIGTGTRFCELLLERGVALMPGEPFGGPGYIRLSFALGMPELERGLDRLERFVGELES